MLFPVNVDPEELRRFAGDLKKFNANVLQRFDKLTRETNRLGNSWQDQEFEKFKNHALPMLQLLKRFTNESDKLIPKLQRDADAIEEYRKQSL